MPSDEAAIDAYLAAKILYMPAKAANAGGVAVSALEMSQNSERLSWSFEEVDQKLHTIMRNIYHNAANAAAEYGMEVNIYKNVSETAKKYGCENNFVVGANIAGFEKVATAMLGQGLV